MKSEETNDNKNRSKSSKAMSVIILLLAIVLAVVMIITNGNILGSSNKIDNSHDSPDSSVKISKGFIKAVTSDDDSNYKIIHVSNPEGLKLTSGFDDKAGMNVRRVYNGRRINIAVTGLDSRLGTRSNHADANHVLSILVDSGQIEIYSVPRDTPADAGMEDSTGQNKLTVVRAVRGREAYHEELANIVGLDKIHYYIEVGFSQAMGMLEWLGYKESGSALQVLRSRTGLGGDDFQRCYNQAQFIRQMILRHFHKFTGVFGDIMTRGGIALLETNLSADAAKDIISKLNQKGFPKSPDDIKIYVRPPLLQKFKIYDFTNKAIITELKNKIQSFNENYSSTITQFVHDEGELKASVISKLHGALSSASADSAKKPAGVISKLRVLFDQRAWLQVMDLKKRENIREQFKILLAGAYRKKKDEQKARQVEYIIESEKNLFSHPADQ